MPQAANIVLKDSSGTDRTFTLFARASGTQPAIWYYQNGANRTVWPKLECSSAKAGSGDARKVKWTLTVPEAVVDPITGVTRASAKQFSSLDHTTPNLVSGGAIGNAVAFLESLAGAAQYTESIATGYAPS